MSLSVFRPLSSRSIWQVLAPASLAVALVVGHTSAGLAQSQQEVQTLIDRLQRLEESMSTLSRTVYRGAKPTTEQIQSITAPAPGSVSSSVATNDLMFDRMQALENQMGVLTGKIETIEHHLGLTIQRFEQFQKEMDIRLSRLQPGGFQPGVAGVTPQQGQGVPVGQQNPGLTAPAGTTSQPAITLTAPQSVASVPDSPVTPATNPSATATGNTQPGVLGQISTTEAQQADQGVIAGQQVANPGLVRPGTTAPAAQPVPQSIPTNPSAQQVATAAPAIDPTLSPENKYQAIRQLLNAQQYEAAETALRDFVAQHKDHSLASNAQYWLGETLYIRKLYIDAAKTFLVGYKTWPKGNKAPDSLLKLGMSLRSIGETEKACGVYRDLEAGFPNASQTIKRYNKREMKIAGCTAQ